jgi:hypothetical protein
MHEITFLGSRDVIGAKRFTPVETIDYACGFGPYSVQRREVEDLPQLLNVLRACTSNWFYVRGDARGATEIPYRRKLVRDEQPATLFEAPFLTIVPIDIDGGVCALEASLAERAELGRELLPPEFRAAACIAQATASCKIKTGLRMRLFYICERGVSNAECKQLLDGIADVGIYSAEHVTYVCAPQFDGVPDPFAGESRWLMVEGEPLLKWPARQETASTPMSRTETGPIGVGDRHRMLTVHAGQLARLKLPQNVIEEQLVAFSEHAFSEPLPASRRGEISALARRAGEWSEDAPALPAQPREGEVVISLAAEKALRAAVKRVRLEPKCWRGEVAKLALFAARAQLSADAIVREISKEGVGSVTTEEIATELAAQVALVAGDEGVFEPGQKGKGELADVMPQLKCSADTGAIIKSVSNMRTILEGGQFQLWLNSRNGQTILQRAPWLVDHKARAWGDHDAAEAANWLSNATAWPNMPADPEPHVKAIAAGNPRDPWLTWLSSLTWDGTPRLGAAARDLLGVQSEREQCCFAWWLMSAAARTLRPGCKVDYVLVLEGAQGRRKSTFLSELVNVPEVLKHMHGTELHTSFSGHLDTNNPRVLGKLRGPAVIELGEGFSVTRSDVGLAKEFITTQVDRWTPMFGRNVRNDPRTFVLAMTVNPQQYLLDATGNRRFWPLECAQINLAGLGAVREQLWAEAVARVNAGQAWWPSAEQESALGMTAAVEERVWLSPEAEAASGRLAKLLNGNPAEAAQVEPWQCQDGRIMAVTLAQLSGMEPRAASGALTSMGWKQHTARPFGRKGVQVRVWVRSGYTCIHTDGVLYFTTNEKTQ